MIIVNQECDFIVKNLKAVEALKESCSQAEKRVPDWLRSEVFRELGRRINEMPFHGEIEWEYEENEDEVTLTPKQYYDGKHEMGLFYGIEYFNWDSLTAENREDGLWAYLYYNLPDKTPKNMKQKIQKWEDRLRAVTEKRKSELLERYHVFPDEDDKNYLVKYYLNNTLNAESLGVDPKEAIKEAVGCLIQLVEDTKEMIIPHP